MGPDFDASIAHQSHSSATEWPEAVAKLIGRRLAAMEKAKSQIDWQKERAFHDDLAAREGGGRRREGSTSADQRHRAT